MFRSFRKGEAEHPATYVRAIAAVLAEYPEEIVMRVTDPRVGLPNTSQFLPNIKEVRDACESYMLPLRRQLEWEQKCQREKAEREARDALPKANAKSPAIAQHLAEVDRRRNENMIPLPPERLAQVCAEDLLQYGKECVTISPQVRAIINSSEVAAEMLREAEAAADAAAMQRATARARRRSSGKRDAA